MKRLAAITVLLVALLPGHAAALERGDTGPAVVEVQTILDGFGYTVIIDGRYGPQTEKAVRSWQRSNGLRVDGVVGPVTLDSLRRAVRMGNAHTVTGVGGRGFAPDGLTGCDEMRFYREQWGLPAEFDRIGWRESNCRQELGVHTSCCWGWLQLSLALHLRDHRLVEPYHACGIFAREDADGPEPIEKQRHMCAVKVLYDLLGYQPWRLTA